MQITSMLFDLILQYHQILLIFSSYLFSIPRRLTTSFQYIVQGITISEYANENLIILWD